MLLRPQENQTGRAMGIVMSAFVSIALLLLAVDTGRVLGTLLPPLKPEPMRLISLFTQPEPVAAPVEQPQRAPSTTTQQAEPAVAVPSESQAVSNEGGRPVAVEEPSESTQSQTVEPTPRVASLLPNPSAEGGTRSPLWGLHPRLPLVDGSGSSRDTAQRTAVYGDDPSGNFMPVEQQPTLDMAALYRNIEYPEIARKSGVTGTVYMRVLVGVDGRVEQVKLVHSDHMLLEKEAVRAAQEAVFSPGMQNGVAVRVWMVIPVTFKM